MKTKFFLGILVIALMLITACSDVDETNNDNDLNKGGLNEQNTDNSADEEGKLIVYYFWGDGCPFCDTQKPYLDEWEEKYSEDIIIKRYETWRDSSNVPLFREVAKAHGTEARGVPATFIGERNWAGFTKSMANDMESYIQYCIENGCESLY